MQRSVSGAEASGVHGVRSGLPADFYQRFSRCYVDANGIRLHCVMGGPSDGEMVVLLHGWPQTWYTWRRVMPPLAEAGYRVVAVDYRGAGESDKPQGGYDKATMAADIRALVHELNTSRIYLVARDIAGREHEYILDFYKKRSYVPIADEDIAVYARAYAAPGGLRAGFELYRAFPEDERHFKEFMNEKLPMPVLALAGDKSNGMTELEMARDLADDVQGGVVPDTGHWTPDENPEFLASELIRFLRESTG